MNLINTYLKAKHWQLFTAFFAPFVLLQVFIYGFFINQIESFVAIDNNEDPDNINPEEMFNIMFELFDVFKYLFFIILVFSLIAMFWNWAITIGLQKHIPNELRINLKRFKIFFFVPIIYLVIILFIGFSFLEDLPNLISFFEAETTNDEMIRQKVFGLLKFVPLFFILHFFSFFCSLHTLYFTAKTIKLAEVKKKLKSDSFIGEFFMLWFNFIGVWILQPRINKLDKEELNNIN